MWRYMPVLWSTIPIRSRSSRERCCGSWPSTETMPLVLVRYPSRISTVVVLPAPLGPEQSEDLARRDLEIEPAHGVMVAVALVKIADEDGRCGGAHRQR